MNLLTVIGTRPQFIKAAVTSKALASHGVNETLINTGQHFDRNMSGIFIEQLEIPKPTADLQITGSTHATQTADMLTQLEPWFIKSNPDAVLVYGDTNSTLAGALTAAKMNIPIVHVEAGLRSFNERMPEETNRVIADRISTLLFAPTERAAEQLLSEGIKPTRVKVSGDVMLDLFRQTQKTLNSKEALTSEQVNRQEKPQILITSHRAENVDIQHRLEAITLSMIDLSKDMNVVWPLHPRTDKRLIEFGFKNMLLESSVTLTEPVGYLQMIELILNSALICTDSGGLQKEAFFGGKPCVTIRDETEWGELVEGRWNRLCPPEEANKIITAVNQSIGTVGIDISPYGEGNAADLIAQSLIETKF